MWGGGVTQQLIGQQKGYSVKICRISQGNAWESFENCVLMTNNGKFIGKYILYIGLGTRD